MNVKEIFIKFIPTLVMLCIHIASYSQSPQGFSYQGVVRNNAGTIVGNQAVGVKVIIENSLSVEYYSETQTTTTNAQGVFNITIGNGTRTSNGLFKDIPWANGIIRLKIGLDITGGTSYTFLENPTELKSVPYALYAENVKEVIGSSTATDNDPIFVVKNNTGQIVFAVYPKGVRMYVDDLAVKGAKGGFAIGGLSGKASSDYFLITPDSARVRLKDPVVKGAKGGFAIGGLSGKGAENYLELTPNNYFIGHRSGLKNSSGTGNIFLGYESGLNNFGGTNNILLGYQSGYNIYNGGFNILMGYKSGYSLQNGSDNIFIGFESGFNSITSGNMFLGFRAGYSNTIGNFNIYVGTNTAYWNTTGAKNTFIGYTSGVKNTSGNQNTFYGFESGVLNETGSDNAFIGSGSGYHNISGTGNVYLGSGSGQNVDGSGNIFIGNLAGSQSVSSTSNRLIIQNSNSDTPLIYGEFDNGKVKLNASVNIKDFMVLEPQASAPSNPTKGTVYFNGTDNIMYCWDGSVWRALF